VASPRATDKNEDWRIRNDGFAFPSERRYEERHILNQRLERVAADAECAGAANEEAYRELTRSG
jgi:hypothetical protein